MRLLICSGLLMLNCLACSSTVSQAKVAVADEGDRVTRQDALNVIPLAICKRYESCEKFGQGKKYATKEDCETNERAKWGKAWPEDKCGSKGLAAGKVKECEDRASNWACSNNVLDFGTLLTECGAGDVCKG